VFRIHACATKLGRRSSNPAHEKSGLCSGLLSGAVQSKNVSHRHFAKHCAAWIFTWASHPMFLHNIWQSPDFAHAFEIHRISAARTIVATARVMHANLMTHLHFHSNRPAACTRASLASPTALALVSSPGPASRILVPPWRRLEGLPWQAPTIFADLGGNRRNPRCASRAGEGSTQPLACRPLLRSLDRLDRRALYPPGEC
jgi:hypothetical protein